MYACDAATAKTVDILMYTTNTSPWYPTDALVFLLDLDSGFMRSKKVKAMRQRYAVWHNAFPRVLNALTTLGCGFKTHGLLPDVEWITDGAAVTDAPNTETIMVRLSGEGATLILTGPSGVGKSHLAQLLVRLPLGMAQDSAKVAYPDTETPYDGDPSADGGVFETDSVDVLPEVIHATVVVLDPRFLVDDVVVRIPGGKAMVGELYEREKKNGAACIK